jgi:integrase
VGFFTGMREGEILGLKWDCVDFDKGTIRIDKQLRRQQKKGGQYYFSSPKNDKARIITPAPWVMKLLCSQRVRQTEGRLPAGSLWQDSGLAFTNA